MPKFPKNNLAKIIVQQCLYFDIDTVVISPGSRNAPLIIGFNGVPEIEKLTVVDERSAAFFAMGIAQQKQKPVAIICTSGSALLNYYPAVAEAYYSNIPLVVISADRPKHLIEIGDGQTIKQENALEKHTLVNVNLDDEQQAKELLKYAISTSIKQKGPVHINAPFDEPLYDLEDFTYSIDKYQPYENPILKDEISIEDSELENYAAIWNNSSKKMVLVGEFFPDELLQKQLEQLAKDPSVLILVENTSNVFNDKFINSIDKLIFPLNDEDLNHFKPDILLSFGGMIVSKKIKQHLRKYQPTQHWHIDPKRAYDTFFCLTKHFTVSPQLFLSQFLFKTSPTNSNYQSYWLEKKQFRIKKHSHFLKDIPFSDLKIFDIILEKLPKNIQLQLSNSSVIRYAQLFDIDPSIQVFCNRGTSGIDGSTSTAVGAAFASNKQTIFITGDLSFFYDSNGLWNQYIPSNFRIILINNGGGGIFRFIPGPKESNMIDYFEAPHNLNAKHLADMFGFEYIRVDDLQSLENVLVSFFDDENQLKLLEIFTPREKNDVILKQYFKSLA